MQIDALEMALLATGMCDLGQLGRIAWQALAKCSGATTAAAAHSSHETDRHLEIAKVSFGP
jgi:hypothetical protein